MQPGHARALIGLHRAAHIHRAAIARVGVGHQRQAGGVGDAPGIVRHLGHGEQAHIRHAEPACRRARARHVDGVEAGLRHEPRADAVHDPGRDQDFGRLHKAFQACGAALGHRLPSSKYARGLSLAQSVPGA